MENLKLEVPLIKQQEQFWCWAACIEMFLIYCNNSPRIEGLDFNQSAIVSEFGSTLPDLKKDDGFNFQINIIENLKGIYDRLKRYYSIDPNRCSIIESCDINQIIESLSKNNALPIFALIKQGEAAGHVVLVIGFEKNNNDIKLIINNPGVGRRFRQSSEIEAKTQTITINSSGFMETPFTILKYLKFE